MKYIYICALLLPFFLFSQSNDYQLIVKYQADPIYVDEEIQLEFYLKNNSKSNIMIPSSSARGISDLFTHEFKMFNSQNELLNKRFKCGVGGSDDRRIISGTPLKPGDSLAVYTHKLKITSDDPITFDYLYDLHPSAAGMEGNIRYNDILLSKRFTISPIAFVPNTNFEIEYKRLTSEQYAKAPVVGGLLNALKNPAEVYRLNLNNPTAEDFKLLMKFKNIQGLSISGNGIDSIPNFIFDLYLRDFTLMGKVKNGFVLPTTIKNSRELTSFITNDIGILDVSNLYNYEFPELTTFIMIGVNQVLDIALDPKKTPKLKTFRVKNSAEIRSFPIDFSSSQFLNDYEINSPVLNFPGQLIMPSVTKLSILSGEVKGVIPDFSLCPNLVSLNIHSFNIPELPISLLELNNLKSMMVSKQLGQGKTFKALSKKGIRMQVIG